MRTPEVRGTIYDYANGKYEVIHEWESEAVADQGFEILGSMLNGGRDAIYIMTLTCGPQQGAFLVVDSNRVYYERAFWTGIYDVKEAFLEVRDYCRQVADKMGFRRLDENEPS
jgi:hypothetical protein